MPPVRVAVLHYGRPSACAGAGVRAPALSRQLVQVAALRATARTTGSRARTGSRRASRARVADPALERVEAAAR